eukprot:1160000-Pelagomonas_calceolata.AAC.17
MAHGHVGIRLSARPHLRKTTYAHVGMGPSAKPHRPLTTKMASKYWQRSICTSSCILCTNKISPKSWSLPWALQH